MKAVQSADCPVSFPDCRAFPDPTLRGEREQGAEPVHLLWRTVEGVDNWDSLRL